jgi:hypothetical protein
MDDYIPTESELPWDELSPVPPPPHATADALTSDLRGRLLGIYGDKDLSGIDKAAAIGRTVVESLQRRGRFFHHTEHKDFKTAMFFDSFRKQLQRLQSDAFLAWVSELVALSRSDWRFKYIQTAMENAAIVHPDSKPIIPAAFWASRPGRIYLSNGDGHVVRITPGAVEQEDNGTDGVVFAAGQTLKPWKLTEPRDPFQTCRVFSGMSTEAPHGTDLLRLWAYSLPTAPASKPPLVTTGSVGSGKTRTLKGLVELLGIPWIALKVEEKTESDFWPAVNGGGVLVLDNADTRTRWLPDLLATAATDGCASRRRLYTDDETVVLRANAWIGITSANPTFGNDPGLADRLMIVRLRRRAGETADGELSAEIANNRDAGLSHLAHTLAAALADQAPVLSGLNSRHPDFARFAVRIGRALGREQESIEALRAAECDKATFCIENDPIAAALFQLVERDGRVTGTAAEIGQMLLKANPADENPNIASRVSPKSLTRKLSALWPHLEKVMTARRVEDRKTATRFSFERAPGGFGGFEGPISKKSVTPSLVREVFGNDPFETPNTPALDGLEGHP